MEKVEKSRLVIFLCLILEMTCKIKYPFGPLFKYKIPYMHFTLHYELILI